MICHDVANLVWGFIVNRFSNVDWNILSRFSCFMGKILDKFFCIVYHLLLKYNGDTSSVLFQPYKSRKQGNLIRVISSFNWNEIQLVLVRIWSSLICPVLNIVLDIFLFLYRFPSIISYCLTPIPFSSERKMINCNNITLESDLNNEL